MSCRAGSAPGTAQSVTRTWKFSTTSSLSRLSCSAGLLVHTRACNGHRRAFFYFLFFWRKADVTNPQRSAQRARVGGGLPIAFPELCSSAAAFQTHNQALAGASRVPVPAQDSVEWDSCSGVLCRELCWAQRLGEVWCTPISQPKAQLCVCLVPLGSTATAEGVHGAGGLQEKHRAGVTVPEPWRSSLNKIKWNTQL